MLRIFHDLISQPLLDDPAFEHDDRAVCQHPNDSQIMRNDNHRNAAFPLDLFNQIENIRLNGQI